MLQRIEGRAQRFISPDPAGDGTRVGKASRPYAYVANDPMNRTDPLGLFGVNKDPYAGGTLLHGGASLGSKPVQLSGGGLGFGGQISFSIRALIHRRWDEADRRWCGRLDQVD
jgi:hypothetical protein